jgi:hypothetical protein
MADLIVAAIVVFILYKFVFNFILPVYRTTKMVKQKVGEMNNFRTQQTGGTSNTNTSYQQDARKETSTPQPKVGEYIDFEEIKD